MSVREIDEGWLVECDEADCRSRDRLYFDDERPSEALIRAYGWESVGMSDHRCEECAQILAQRELPPAIEPEPGKPWQPVRGRIGGTVYG